MKRHEAVALLKELSAEHLLQPSWVLIEQRKPDSYQLCIKGAYDRSDIGIFVQRYNLEIEDSTKGYLCIFKP